MDRLAEMQKQLEKLTAESENLPIPERPDIKNLGDLPLRSDYRALIFYGRADGGILNKGFEINDLIGRIFVLKSLKLICYNDDNYIDIMLKDVATQKETIPPRARTHRLFDDFITGAQIDFVLNGAPVSVFPTTAEGGFPGDLHLDNIYYRFPQKLVTFDLSVDMKIFVDIEAGTTDNPFLKVFVECYLL